MAGCFGSGSHSVTFQVMTVAEDGTEQPAKSALVRAIPMGTSPVPLPINSKTMQELGDLKRDADYTDERGRVTLDIATTRSFAIEVVPPLLEPESSTVIWEGWIDEKAERLTTVRTDDRLKVELIR